jgi:hypothetical protein
MTAEGICRSSRKSFWAANMPISGDAARSSWICLLAAKLLSYFFIGGSKIRMFNWMATFWCRATHRSAMWPIHGRYICPQCMREYPVAWSAGELKEADGRDGSLALEARSRLSTTS